MAEQAKPRSKRLAEKTGLPLIHLDRYYHIKRYNYYENKEKWHKKAESLAERNAWVMDGNYKMSLDARLKRADTVIFLDYPLRIRLWRVFRRCLQYRNKQRPDMPGTWKERIDPAFFWYIVNYDRKSRPVVMESLKKYPDVAQKIFTSPKVADEFLQSLSEGV